MLGVIARQRADPVGAQELVLVEHAGQDPAQPVLVDQRHDAALGDAEMARPGRMDRLAQLRHAPQALCRLPPSVWAPARAATGSMTVVAQSGSRPTIERTLSRVALPSGRRRTS